MPKRSPKAIVDPLVLQWLRTSSGYSVEEVARRLQTKKENVEKWEAGNSRPSMPQLRKLALAFKRPISDFYLPEPMPEPPIPHDFRRVPAEGAEAYSPSLRHEIRLAYRRRILALDLREELEIELHHFQPYGTISVRDDPEIIGRRVREMLNVTLGEQTSWREPRVAYNAWRNKIEALDVLVFQVMTVEIAQMLGFSLAFEQLPVIVVNRKLRPNGRIFTLLHEFVHLLLGGGGICDLDEDLLRSPQEQSVEVFANHAAGAALVPQDVLLAHRLVDIGDARPREWSDEVLDSLAKDFSVSEEVVLRRLLIAGHTTAQFYAAKRQQYLARMRRLAEAEREKLAGEFRRNIALETASNLGSFARLVVDSYHSDAINLTDASKFLGVKAEKVPAVADHLR